MLGFDALEFVHQAVVFPVTNNRRVEDVVAMVVPANLLAEGLEVLIGGHG